MNIQYDVEVQAAEDYTKGRECPYAEGSYRCDLWHAMMDVYAEEDSRAREAEEDRAREEEARSQLAQEMEEKAA